MRMTTTATQNPTTEERLYACEMLDAAIDRNDIFALKARQIGHHSLEDAFRQAAMALEDVRDAVVAGRYFNAGRLANKMKQSVQEQIPENVLAIILTAYDNAMES